MWKMFDEMIECSECGGPLGPPPKFMIPPPPRPPSMGEYTISNCDETEMALKAQQAWDNDMCEAIPILDASSYSSQSLQTSAMIAVFSLLLVLVVLISSLFVWKNKRKMQNFLPCKTPTRGPHINGGLPISSGHSVTYEDPDVHLGHHRPLVIRHHHNVEMLQGKSIHYPSGYPMTRSPPFLVSSSPGPDPYRSNDNVYEELGPGRDSDGESEAPMHSDDDFAEDELSLPGERSFNKSNISEVPPTQPAASTMYHEHTATAAAGACGLSNSNGPERNSVLSSSSSTQEASTATAASSSSSHNNKNSINPGNATNSNSISTACNTSSNSIRNVPKGLLSGMLRHTTGRSKLHTTNGVARSANAIDDEYKTNASAANTSDFCSLQQNYDKGSNLMSLAYVPHQLQHNHHHLQQQQAHHPMHIHPAMHSPAYHPSMHRINNNNNSHVNIRAGVPQFYNTLESDVERRNRINAQLSHAPAVATIFRERIHYPGSGRYVYPPQPYYVTNSNNGLLANSARTRTNPRSMDRRQRMAPPINPIETTYGYAEPVYHENYHYDTCESTPALQHRLALPPAYIVPNYTNSSGGGVYCAQANPASSASSTTYQNSTHLYSRGDSSFGSDSGYSHHTPASSIGRHDYDITLPIPEPPTQKTPSKLSAAFTFGWNRRKPASNASPPLDSTITPNSSSGAEATSPNNNSACSTITSTLENSSSGSSTTAATSLSTSNSAQNNNIHTIATAQVQT